MNWILVVVVAIALVFTSAPTSHAATSSITSIVLDHNKGGDGPKNEVKGKDNDHKGVEQKGPETRGHEGPEVVDPKQKTDDKPGVSDSPCQNHQSSDKCNVGNQDKRAEL